MSRDYHYDIPLFAQPFHFMRHGESESNRANIIAGLCDVPLTELGREQARAAVDAVRARCSARERLPSPSRAT